MSVLSLALGIGACTAIFSIVDAVLVRSLPYPDAHRLYHVMYAPPGPWEPRGMTGLDWTSVTDVIDHPIASASDSATYFEGGSALAGRGLRVTDGFVDGLGLRVVLGRRFTPQDFRVGSERVALIGYTLWRDRFSSDPAAIGRVIRAEPESPSAPAATYRVVGVLEPGFYFGRDSRATVDLLIPQTSVARRQDLYLDTSPTQALDRFRQPGCNHVSRPTGKGRNDIKDSHLSFGRSAPIFWNFAT